MNETTKLSSGVTAYLEWSGGPVEDDDVYVNGGMLGDARYAWLSCSSKFCVVDTATGHKFAAWTFGANLRNFNAKVTCVAEVPTPLIEGTLQLVIGLECELIGGMVCLFHCNGSRILRAVQIDCQITSLRYVETIQSSVFSCFDGAVIIGTQGGGVYVFDMNRQSCSDAIVRLNSGIEPNIRDERNIANLVVLSVDDIDLITQQRSIACKKDHHIAVQINEESVHNLQFIFYNPDSTIKTNSKREEIFVSNVVYVPQLLSVIVGFNIGIFQIWNLTTLKLEYTSHPTDDALPITQIGFLEPCDDPRAFCYIWIVHSTLSRHDERFPLAAMYSLTYQEKKHMNEHEFLYHTFVTCNLRFNIELTNTDNSSTLGKQFIGGRCLGYQTLSKTGNRDDIDEFQLNVCQIMWECWTLSAITPVQSLMMIFDIDQWYKEQMPEICELKTNNYMSIVNISEAATNVESYICDVKINLDSLMSYMSVQRLEEHFYPNALGYDCYCLSNTEITKFTTLGIQRQILASINSTGPSVLLHPSKLYNQCTKAGLIPLYVDTTLATNISEPLQRQIILSIALEARLIQFLGKCAYDWATGSHTSSGCNLQLLLDWSWSRALVLKQNGDNLTVPLFNHSGDVLDRNSIQCLDSSVRQLGHISSLYNIIIEKCSSYLLPEKNNEIAHRQSIVKIVAQYFQVIQWFLNVGLLPEYNEQISDNDHHLPYPIESLVQYYQNRRLKLHCLNGESQIVENLKNKCCDLLFIDQFIKNDCSEDKLTSLWMGDHSVTNGLYPPPSLHSLLKVYLLPEIKEEHKHSLVLYVLVDYAMIFDDERYESVIRRLMQFPTMFGLSSMDIKVMQAFWHLDHRDFQLALNQLQCVLAGDRLTQWQHNVVLSSLLVQKKTQAALQYLHVRKPEISASDFQQNSSIFDDWDACSNLYLSRGLVYEAFHFNKQSNKNISADMKQQRLKAFFEGCKKLGLLPKIVLLPLTQCEENDFVTFLKTMDCSYSNDILVLYYLHRSRYIEAHQINEELKRFTCKDQLPYNITSDFTMQKDHSYKTEARDQLVDLYCRTLPPITRHLAQLAHTNVSGNKIILPTPMTVSIQNIKHKTASYKSSFIQATIEKANETWLRKSGFNQGLKRGFQIEETPFLCTPKLQKHISCFEEKMSTTPDGETPVKKRRLSDNQTLERVENLSPNVSSQLKKEIDNILHTPVIKRLSKSRMDLDHSINRRNSFREATPQSILKVRRYHSNLLPSPLDEKFLTETDDELETASQFTQTNSLSRSIRFNIPSRNGSITPNSECISDVQESFIELCQHAIDSVDRSSSQSANASARKSIHDKSPLLEEKSDFTLNNYLVTTKNDIPDESVPVENVNSQNVPITYHTDIDTNMENRSSHSTGDMSQAENNTIETLPITPIKMPDSTMDRNYNDTTNGKNLITTNASLLISDTSDAVSDSSYIISSQTIQSYSIAAEKIVCENKESKISVENVKGFHSSFMQRLVDEKYKSLDNDHILKETDFDVEKDVHEDSFKSIQEIELSHSFKNHSHDNESLINDAQKSTNIIEVSNSDQMNECNIEIFKETTSMETFETNTVEVVPSSFQDTSDNNSNTSKELYVVSEIMDENVDLLVNVGSMCEESVVVRMPCEPEEQEITYVADVTDDNKMSNEQLPQIKPEVDCISEKPCSIYDIDQKSTSILPNEESKCLEEHDCLEDSSKSHEESSKSLEESSKSLEESSKSLGESSKSLEESSKSLEESSKSLDESSKSLEESSKSPEESKSLEETKCLEEPKSLEENKCLEESKMSIDHSEYDSDSKMSSSRRSILGSSRADTLSQFSTFSPIKEGIKTPEETESNIDPCEYDSDSKISSSRQSILNSSRANTLSQFSVSPIPKEELKASDDIEPSEYDSDSKMSSSRQAILDSSRANTLSQFSNSPPRKEDMKTPEKHDPKVDTFENDSDRKTPISQRSTRRSPKIDTLSQSSVDSDQDTQLLSKRKSRRSMLTSIKPNLSVIPETSQMDDKLPFDRSNLSRSNNSHNVSNLIDQYSSSRRLTRHQRSLLEKSLEISQIQKSTSIMETEEQDDSDDSDGNVSQCSNTTEKTLDPIFLLDKPDFQGPPDLEEKNIFGPIRTSSRASSIASDIGVDPPKDRKSKHDILKRMDKSSVENSSRSNTPIKLLDTSLDPGNSSMLDSPSSRPRRQSFNKAIEALCTPKRRRRTSIDSKKSDTEATNEETEKNIPELDKQPVTSAVLLEDIGEESNNDVIIDGQKTMEADKKIEVATSSNIKSTPTVKTRKSKKASSIHGDKPLVEPPEQSIPESYDQSNCPPKRTPRIKAASIHGDELVADKNDLSTPARRITRRAIFATPLTKEEEMTVNLFKQRSSLKKRSGMHKVMKPLQFDLRKK